MDWSFQLYNARNFQPWDKVIKMIAGLGFKQVEGFPGVYGDAAGIRAELDRNGLTMPTGHFPLDMLENDFSKAMDIADTLGVELMICPHIGPDQRAADEAGWRSFAHRLAAINDACGKAGKGFAWHNHDFEFRPLVDSTVPMRVILDAAPEIGWEMDVAWVVRGGSDPLAWIDEYATRIVAAHVKDIAPHGQNTDEDGWADIGHGTMDWPYLMKVLREKAHSKYFVMEHDNPNDIERFASRSMEAAKKF